MSQCKNSIIPIIIFSGVGTFFIKYWINFTFLFEFYISKFLGKSNNLFLFSHIFITETFILNVHNIRYYFYYDYNCDFLDYAYYNIIINVKMYDQIEWNSDFLDKISLVFWKLWIVVIVCFGKFHNVSKDLRSYCQRSRHWMHADTEHFGNTSTHIPTIIDVPLGLWEILFELFLFTFINVINI